MRGREEVIRDFVRQWLNKAEGDLTALRDDLAPCGWLTPFGVEFRYPGEYPEVDRPTAQNALAEAKRVRRMIMKHLEQYLSGEDQHKSS